LLWGEPGRRLVLGWVFLSASGKLAWVELGLCFFKMVRGEYFRVNPGSIRIELFGQQGVLYLLWGEPGRRLVLGWVSLFVGVGCEMYKSGSDAEFRAVVWDHTRFSKPFRFHGAFQRCTCRQLRSADGCQSRGAYAHFCDGGHSKGFHLAARVRVVPRAALHIYKEAKLASARARGPYQDGDPESGCGGLGARAVQCLWAAGAACFCGARGWGVYAVFGGASR
jgi:hypothetical protein